MGLSFRYTIFFRVYYSA